MQWGEEGKKGGKGKALPIHANSGFHTNTIHTQNTPSIVITKWVGVTV